VNIFDDRVEFMNPGAFPPGTKPKDFLRRPHSEPVNEKIANALFKGGEKEGWGRGILDIFTLCKDAGMPEPEYDFVQNFVCLTIRFKQPLKPYVSGSENGGENGGVNGGLNGGVNGGVQALTPSQKRVYDVVHDNPGLNTKQIADILNKSPRTVEKHLTFLRTKGLIVHKDSDKTGGYYPL
jgi:ATP-dependent DNA helicase RecG